MKNNVLTLPNKRVVWMSRTYHGKVHDKHICDQQKLCLPPGITLWQDGEFQGYNHESVMVKMSTRKHRDKELTDAQRDENKAISSFRVYIEHYIGRVKKFPDYQRTLPLPHTFFDDLIFEIACGLHNFKISLKM